MPSIAEALAKALSLKDRGTNPAIIELEIKRMTASDREPFDEPR